MNKLLAEVMSLPDDVRGIVFDFIRPQARIATSREEFGKNYLAVLASIQETSGIDSYIRDVIRGDRTFVFPILVRLSYGRWMKIERWRFNFIVFPTYAHYVYYLCRDYGRQALLNELVRYEKGIGVYDKNRHKKIRFRHIRWSNST